MHAYVFVKIHAVVDAAGNDFIRSDVELLLFSHPHKNFPYCHPTASTGADWGPSDLGSQREQEQVQARYKMHERVHMQYNRYVTQHIVKYCSAAST